MTSRPDDTTRSIAKKRLAVIVAGGIAGIAVGLAAVYGISTLQRNPAANAACQGALETAKRIAPLVTGEIAAVTAATKPLKLPDITFRDAEGKERKLSDWHGRTVLLNLWATWCVPCRKEMPALEALEKKLGGPGFEVVAVNIDTRNPDKPKAWLKEVGVTGLTYYADPNAKVFQDLKAIGRAFGMPTTLLVGPNGCEIAYLAGPAEWASPAAVKMVHAALTK
jgi:thiol-disulfide isomerase/thioredoxin